MKKFFKAAIIALVFTTTFAAAELRAQDDSKGLGLTVGLDYVSNYMNRGQYGFFAIDSIGGFVFPYASFDVFGTGLTLEVRGEVSETWFVGSDEEDNDSASYAQDLHSVDFHAGYTYNIDEIVTLNAGAWYYRYKTMQNEGISYNFSYFDFYLSAAIDALPLTPTLAITYSHFTDSAAYRSDYIDEDTGERIKGDGKSGDFYFQLGIGHSFELADATYLDFGAVAGYYYKRAIEPKSPDISDIDLSAGLSTTSGIVTFTGSFHYVIVPGTQFKTYDDNKDIHRFYARFGASVSI